MSIDVIEKKAASRPSQVKLGIADGDIHQRPRSNTLLYPYMAERWRRYMDAYGVLRRHGHQTGPAYPKGSPGANRRDACPPGGIPGDDLAFMQAQHLDPNNVELGILNPIQPGPSSVQNLDFAEALCTAVNDWQVAEWTEKDRRLKASIVVSYEDAPAAVAEIERCAPNKDFAQVLFMSRTCDPMGQRRYWPIYEAAARHNLPIGVHAFGYGGHPVSGSGWPSFYLEEMLGHAQGCQAQLVSMVIEGVFERIPELKLVLIESGFAWLPSLAWRLDKNWKVLKEEVPHLKRAPSEYIRENVWVTTQPMEEPEKRRHLTDIIDWIGWDRLIFATDYPHWDYDDPATAFPIRISEEHERMLFRENARTVYGR